MKKGVTVKVSRFIILIVDLLFMAIIIKLSYVVLNGNNYYSSFSTLLQVYYYVHFISF